MKIKNFQSRVCVCALLATTGYAQKAAQKWGENMEQNCSVHLIPYPDGVGFVGAGKQEGIYLPEKLAIDLGGFSSECAKAYKTRLAATGRTLMLGRAGEIPRILCRKKALGKEEAYELEVSGLEIRIAAEAEAGVIWALTSLYQLMGEDGFIPAIKLNDAPRYGHRGLHIDCARHFFPEEELERILEEVSRVKINRFHWHLANDQGWRIEMEKYPVLHQQCDGAYYSKADVAKLVAFAKQRGITVIPEIDMPGHTRAILAAYPQYSCSGKKVELARYGGIYPVILCPGREETFAFVEDVVAELAPLFPGKAFHIGADEAPKHEWKKCPLCRGRMRKEGLADENELQGYFVWRVQKILEKYGKEAYAFDDCLLAERFVGRLTVQEWMVTRQQRVAEYVRRGGNFIYSDMMDIYYDYPAAMANMERSYSVKPVLKGEDFSDQPGFLGFEACVWTEHIPDKVLLEQRIFPRIYALAENGWTRQEKKDYESFQARLAVLREKGQKERIPVLWGNGDPEGEKRRMEAAKFIRTMQRRIPDEAKADTVEPDVVDEEFNRVFGQKLLNAHGDAGELLKLAAELLEDEEGEGDFENYKGERL